MGRATSRADRGAGRINPYPFALALVLILGFAVITGSGVVTADHRGMISDVVLIPAAAALTVSAVWRIRRSSKVVRRIWLLAALAGALWTVAEVAWAIDEYLLSSDAVPSVADVFYLAAPIAVAAGLLSLPTRRGRAVADRLGVLLGALIVALGVLFISRALLLPVLFPAAPISALARTVYLAYPISDAIMIAIALFNIVRLGSEARLSLGIFSLGVLSYAGADLAYNYYAAQGRYASGSMVDVGWFAGYLLMALAALVPDADQGSILPRRTQRISAGVASVAVYLPLAGSVAVLALRSERISDPVLIVTGILMLALLGFRQALLAVETRRLAHHLEDRVDQLQRGSVELRRLADENARIVQSVAEGIIGVDAEGRITFANVVAGELLGRTPEDVVGRLESEIVHCHEQLARDQLDCRIRQALTDGTSQPPATESFVRPDGEDFPVEMTVGPILEDSVVRGAVVVFRDISERLAVERMKNEFISTVSHELRTPLTAIRGSLGIVAAGATGALSQRGTRLIDIAVQSTERLGRLVDDMLDVERIESGAEILHFGDWRASTLIDTALDDLGPAAAGQGIELCVADPSEHGFVYGDRERIIRTLSHLIENAVKYSEAGDVVLIGAARDGDMIEFRVTDSGPGIPADKLEVIFQRFEQVDSSDSRAKGGTGLGLAVCRTIVQRHGGRIWADSVLGVGSTFRFTVPAYRPNGAVLTLTEPGQSTRNVRGVAS